MIYFLTIIVSLVLLPLVSFKVFFVTSADEDPLLITVLQAFRYVGSFVYLIELVIHLNTAYYSMGKMESSRSKIFEHVKRKTLLWDLVSLIALYYTVGRKANFDKLTQIVEVTIFLKVFSLMLIKKNLEGRFLRAVDSPLYSVL
jgi:uncharacterized membrane protein